MPSGSAVDDNVTFGSHSDLGGVAFSLLKTLEPAGDDDIVRLLFINKKDPGKKLLGEPVMTISNCPRISLSQVISLALSAVL